MHAQKHRIVVDRSEGSKKNLARSLQLPKDVELKHRGQKTQKNSLLGPPLPSAIGEQCEMDQRARKNLPSSL